ncbi:uncharacterized protein LOC105171662 isoform X2 [Sesamum indicum]|uniref:Uncharacterized protein LOC105171662 isoform X2 n=1 Tax=Sesamum indicum TaxID=4182 RepID=A0A8M8VA26_SESIN|nr:uncharacterized protein LOC105171662 isoform X2 [Sesamum indicum]
MENVIELYFKVGELAEARSFQSGYRGAWFRCKIRDITKRKGHIGHVLEYYDFPDEKLKWTKLYQQVPPHHVGKGKEKHRELMLRPCYPPIYNKKQMPQVSEISEVAVIVDDSWKVGDLVDWWTTDCYWSGRITKLLGDDKAEIELHPPPLGEGSSYEVHVKDIRPSLDWSPQCGWSVPNQEGDTGGACAQLIKPVNQVSSNSGTVSDEVKSTGTTERQIRSFGTRVSEQVKDIQEKGVSLGCGDTRTRITSLTDCASGRTSAEPAVEVAEKDLNSSTPLKKYGANGQVTLHSMRSDTFEAAILDLEDYLHKVKRLKAILHYGVSSSDAPRPQWEFVEPHAASEIPN